MTTAQTTIHDGGRPASEVQVFRSYTDDGGLISLAMPREMTANDIDDLEAYFAIILNMKRRVLKAAQDREISIAEGGKDNA